MKHFKADLHIHTKLSPCGSPEMTPRAIVDRACQAGLDIIAICDHNSSRNAAAVLEAAGPRSLVVIPGIELETSERIHVVALFPTVEAALGASEEIGAKLPAVDEAYTKKIGAQIVMGADGSQRGFENSALASPTHLDLGAAVGFIKAHGGLAIAAHVERPSFSVYSQLGDIPRHIPFDALEVSPVSNRPVGIREKFARYGWPLIGSSDSHYLAEIGRAKSAFLIERACFEEIAMALHGEGGRSVVLA